jgi:hypothetical protein
MEAYIIITCNVSVHITAFIPPCKNKQRIGHHLLHLKYRQHTLSYTYNYSIEDAYDKNGSYREVNVYPCHCELDKKIIYLSLFIVLFFRFG